MYYFKSYTKYIGDGNSGISLWNLFQTETEIFDETGKIILHELVYGNKMSEQLREIINSINGPVITPYDLCEDIVRGKDKKSISCITDVMWSYINNKKFVGTELNFKRLAVLLKRLKKYNENIKISL